jgi:hypothetical protein
MQKAQKRLNQTRVRPSNDSMLPKHKRFASNMGSPHPSQVIRDVALPLIKPTIVDIYFRKPQSLRLFTDFNHS